MEKKNNKIILPIVIGLLMIIGVIGVTYAFFNYTRTGSANTVRTGRIYFNHTQDGKIELSNVFPTNNNNLNSTNSDIVTINITGDTTYTEGIEYKVTLDQVNNTINNKEVPISIKATATNLGTEDSNYYTNRENKEKIYLLNEEGEAYNGKYIAVGYIPAGSTGVNGSTDITAFIDTNKVAITDTYLNDTDEDWVMGREVFTTDEWNNFNSSNPLSFKVKVESNEGIWVEPEKFLTMKNLNDITEWANIRANITSIEFHKDGAAPANPATSFDVTDTTSDTTKGRITLYTVDDGLGNGTYKAIVVANYTIYAPEDSSMMFALTTNLASFDSKNFKVDNVTNMVNLFVMCSKLSNISSLANWNVENVTYMTSMFQNTSLTDISSLSNWNVENVIYMTSMFQRCSSLTDASGINDWDIKASADFRYMFRSTPVHPEFTKFPNGTWDENGTFTPNA